MKIYPNTSNIIVTNNVNNITDIPLSYIDTQKLEYSINTVIESSFKNKIKQEVLPYDKMNKNIICLFDKNGNQIDYSELTKHFKYENGDYIFVPYGSTSFNPKIFNYTVVGKKSIVYNSKMQYDIKVSVLSEHLANSLMPAFGDAPLKNIAPSNILINNGSMSYSDLVTGNLIDNDILFVGMNSTIETDDGKIAEFDKVLEYKANPFLFISKKSAIEIDKDTIMDNNEVNLYFSNNLNFNLKKPLIYDNVSLESNLYFNVPNNTDTKKYYNLFNNATKTPILLEEHEGKGFIVYCIDTLLNNIAKYSKILYEIMFFVYSKSYMETKPYREWITDIMPNFIVVNNKLIKKDKFISQTQLHKMFGLNQYEITPYNINIDNELFPFVKFTGLNNNYLTFEKSYTEENEKYKDPVKQNDDISIFTSKQNIIYFNNFLYKIDDSLDENIKVERVGNKINVTVKPFRHSSSGIFIKTLSFLEIPLSYRDSSNSQIQITNADFYIVCKQNESVSYLEFIDSKNYTKNDGLILSTIQVRQDETKTLIYDMRQRGGGLPENEKDNFNCFDIGHIYGRPYRKGGSTIVTLPGKLKEYKKIIEDTVKQYCVAEEYPIIIFKED